MRTNGVIAGVVASWVKALTEPRLQTLTEQVLPPLPEPEAGCGRRSERAPREHPPAVLGKLKDLLGPLGCRRTPIPRWSVLSQQIPLAGIAHQCGTVRFGTDPKSSALDPDCKAHDLDNLYVVDVLERLGAPSATSGATNGLVRADTQTLQPHPTKPGPLGQMA